MIPVLHVVAPGPYGGLETVVDQLVTGLARQGDTVGLVALMEQGTPPAPLVQRVQERGILTRVIAVPHRAYRREREQLRGLFDALAPEVIHTHGYHADVLAGAAARAAGAAVVSTAHGFTGGSLKNRLFEWLQLAALRRADAVVAVSAGVAVRLRGAGVTPARIHLLPNAWGGRPPGHTRSEARRALALPELGTVIGWVGRLSREKDPLLALEALARLRDDQVRLSFVGSGREEARLRARADALRLGPRVRFHAGVTDAAGLLPAFDALCLSSRTEGTPMVLFEAMQAGIPVVATRVGGVPDMLSEREAVLVEPGDPGAMASGLGRVLADPVASAERAAAARDRLEREFGLPAWISRHRELYRSLRAGRAT